MKLLRKGLACLFVGGLFLAGCTTRDEGRGSDQGAQPGDSSASAMGPAVRWPLPFDVPVQVVPLPATPDSPAGTLLVASQTDGRIFLVSPDGSVSETPVIDLPSSPPDGEFGLLGLALHPDYPAEAWVYAFYTDEPSTGEYRFQRIVRFTYPPGAAVAGAPEEVVTGLTTGAACCHNGGRIAFGPDGMLYATLGDNMVSAHAQDPQAPPGSVLRYTPTGEIPSDNPYAGSPAAVKGVRNPFGLTFDSEWGMVVTDNGPSGFDGPGGYDEVDLFEVGDNGGWPLSSGGLVPPGTVGPLWDSGDSHIAPTGVVVPRESLMPEWNGKILWCNYNDSEGRLIDPATSSPEPTTVSDKCRYDVAQDALGRIVFATDGELWVLGG